MEQAGHAFCRGGLAAARTGEAGGGQRRRGWRRPEQERAAAGVREDGGGWIHLGERWREKEKEIWNIYKKKPYLKLCVFL
jgi:hypothetical protein